jgi:hypothetical protein
MSVKPEAANPPQCSPGFHSGARNRFIYIDRCCDMPIDPSRGAVPRMDQELDRPLKLSATMKATELQTRRARSRALHTPGPCARVIASP